MHTEKVNFGIRNGKQKIFFLVSFVANSHATYLLVLLIIRTPSCRCGRMRMRIRRAPSDSHSFDLIFESNFYLADLFFIIKKRRLQMEQICRLSEFPAGDWQGEEERKYNLNQIEMGKHLK